MFIVYENIEHNEIKLIILILWHFIRYSTILIYYLETIMNFRLKNINYYKRRQ